MAAADEGGACLLAVPDHVLADVDHLNAVTRHLSEEVRSIESRQVALDRRLVEFGGLLQGLQEEQYTQTCSFERGQKTVAFGAERALEKAVSVQRRVEEEGEWQACIDRFSAVGLTELERRMEASFEEQRRSLTELSADVAALTLQAHSPGGVDSVVEGRGRAEGSLGLRIAALEKGQKTVSISARRALHTALVVHQQQRCQEHQEEWNKCLDGVASPLTELERHCNQRFGEQEERLDKILQMVDSLADKVLTAKDVHELRQKVDTMEAKVYGLIDSRTQRLAQTAELHEDGLLVFVESLEARTDRTLGEISQRLDALQDGRDQQRLSLRQLGQQLPEVAQKLDQLWTQCQYYFPRVKEHDIHFSFFRTSFENHKQHMLEFADGIERGRTREVSPQEASRADDADAELGSRARMLAEVMARLHSEEDSASGVRTANADDAVS